MRVRRWSIQKVTGFMDKFGSFIEKIEKGEGTIAKFLTDPSIYNNLRDTTKTLSMILKDFKVVRRHHEIAYEIPSLYNKHLVFC